MMFPLKLNRQECSQCGVCESSCSYAAINMGDYPSFDADICRLCGDCVSSCPQGAISIERVDNKPCGANNSSGIWVFVELNSSQKIEDVSLQLISQAKRMVNDATKFVAAILLAPSTERLTREIFAHGADIVYSISDERYSDKIEEHFTNSICHLAKEHNPSILLVGATVWGRLLSARVAATLQTGLTADCTNLSMEGESDILHQCRPAFGGNLMATIKCVNHRPQMASVRANIFKAERVENPVDGQIESCEAKDEFFDGRVRVLEQIGKVQEKESITESQFVIGVGRGVKSVEVMTKIKRLSKLLNCAIAGSRGAVEMGLVDVSCQVGQTGHVISPKCYIALGISGQIQHTAALVAVDMVVAVNSDKNAPIFNNSNYGYVCDVEEFVDSLINTLETNKIN